MRFSVQLLQRDFEKNFSARFPEQLFFSAIFSASSSAQFPKQLFFQCDFQCNYFSAISKTTFFQCDFLCVFQCNFFQCCAICLDACFKKQIEANNLSYWKILKKIHFNKAEKKKKTFFNFVPLCTTIDTTILGGDLEG